MKNLADDWTHKLIGKCDENERVTVGPLWYLQEKAKIWETEGYICEITQLPQEIINHINNKGE